MPDQNTVIDPKCGSIKINADQCWIRGYYIISFKFFTTQQEAAAPNRQSCREVLPLLDYWCVFLTNADQWGSMPIKLKWYQCWSMPINDDQCRSMSINPDQATPDPALIGIDWHWSVLRSIDLYWFSLIDIDIYWSALVSMPQIWSGIDRYWSALIIDTGCPLKLKGSSRN